jgi:long-chain acyl-CoA synthetase
MVWGTRFRPEKHCDKLCCTQMVGRWNPNVMQSRHGHPSNQMYKNRMSHRGKFTPVAGDVCLCHISRHDTLPLSWKTQPFQLSLEVNLGRPYVWDPWLSAKHKPERTAVVSRDLTCTFADLVRQAESIAQGLQGADITDGSVVATDLPPGPELFAIALAALRNGYGFFPVPRGLAAEIRQDLMRQTETAIYVTNTEDATQFSHAISFADLTGLGATQRSPGADLAADRKCGYLVFVTSGTTGEPKVVIRQRPRYPYRGVAVNPLYGASLDKGPHIMANATFHLGTLGPALYALQAGSAVIVQHEWSPGYFHELIDRYASDSAFLSARQLVDTVLDGHRTSHAPQILFHGGSSTSRAVKMGAIRLFGPIIHEFYGTSVGIISEAGSADWLAHRGTVGRPLPGVRVDIRADGGTVPVGTIGNINVRYRSIDSSNSLSLYHDTGDVGCVDDEGYIFVLGRAAKMGDPRTGDPHKSARLEDLVRMIPGIVDVAVIAGSSADGILDCYVEHDPRQPTDGLAEHIADLGRRLDAHRVNVFAHPLGYFARTASGKLHRQKLKATD